MYDSIQVSQIPAQAAYVAGYVNGRWPTAPVLKRAFPHARLLSITITASADADCLDVEQGDATIAQAPGWVKRQLARGLYRPVVYAQASSMGALLHALESAGITRASVRLWAAHYGEGAHICGPASCKYPAIPACDGTQWTPAALGRDLDESVLLADFFDPRPKPKPAPKPSFTWKDHEPMLMKPGAGAITPVALPSGATKIVLTPESTATVGVQTHDHGMVTETLAWQPPGGKVVAIPGGVQFVHLHRIDAGTGDVAYSWE
jgi:hypothetical protein